jgi:carbon storage regulator
MKDASSGTLVLSRKAGQRIKVGDSIVIEINRIQGNVVRVAIKAPKDQRIIREELEGRELPIR